jgi:hypothetical protein
MKKLLLLTALVMMSCSTSDDSNESTREGFTLLYKESCDSPTNEKLCTTQEKYDEAMENKIFVDEICFKIRIDNVWYTWAGGYNFCD